jgi:large subunit ribosomal protein L28
MSRVCQVSGKRTRIGNRVARRGLAKYKGGVGIKTTGITRRQFKVNLHWKRIWVPELNRFVRVRVSTQVLRTINKRGPYPVLLEAGLIKPAK